MSIIYVISIVQCSNPNIDLEGTQSTLKLFNYHIKYMDYPEVRCQMQGDFLAADCNDSERQIRRELSLLNSAVPNRHIYWLNFRMH